jgi:hypothetical protein
MSINFDRPPPSISPRESTTAWILSSSAALSSASTTSRTRVSRGGTSCNSSKARETGSSESSSTSVPLGAITRAAVSGTVTAVPWKMLTISTTINSSNSTWISARSTPNSRQMKRKKRMKILGLFIRRTALSTGLTRRGVADPVDRTPIVIAHQQRPIRSHQHVNRASQNLITIKEAFQEGFIADRPIAVQANE